MATAKKRGNSYRVQVYVGRDENGKRIYRSVTASTKRECEQIATSIRINNHHKEDLTFGEAVSRYIDSKKNVLSPSTIRGYEGIKKNQLDEISEIRLSRITNEDIQKQLSIIASDHEPKTVANARGLISSTMKMFVPGFVLRVKIPAKKKVSKSIPTDEEIKRILETAFRENRPEEIAIMLAIYGSLRRGEIAGLYPDSIYDDHITISRVYVQDEENNWVLKDHPKTFAGYREIPLPEKLLERLKEKINGQTPEKDQFGILGISPNIIYEFFQVTQKHAGIEKPYRFHDLRHYFASWMHEEGIPDKTIAKIGGWDDVTTLQKIYQHSTRVSEDIARSKIYGKFENMQP